MKQDENDDDGIPDVKGKKKHTACASKEILRSMKTKVLRIVESVAMHVSEERKHVMAKAWQRCQTEHAKNS